MTGTENSSRASEGTEVRIARNNNRQAGAWCIRRMDNGRVETSGFSTLEKARDYAVAHGYTIVGKYAVVTA